MSYRPKIKINAQGGTNDFPLDAETISGHSVGYIEINSSSGTLTQEQYNECLKDVAIIKYTYQSSQPKYYIKDYVNISQGSVSSMMFKQILNASYGGENKYNLINYYISIQSNLSYSVLHNSYNSYTSSGVDTLLQDKQDTLTAGDGITIDSDNEISVTNPVEVMTQSEFDTATSGTTPSGDSPFLDLMYPIGSIYISSNSTSPASRFGGTWTRIKDRFILAVGDTYTTSGATGGSADAVVVSHTHVIKYNHEQLNNPSGLDIFSNVFTNNWWSLYEANGDNTQGTVPFSVLSTGESGTGKNMPPYITKYIWERIA